MKSICFLMPYFGEWPIWLDLYLSSCAYNSTINWIFFTDCRPPLKHPPNVRFVAMTWSECSNLLQRWYSLPAPVSHPYKLCDFRFAYGEIFSSYIIDYDYWAFGDIDVVYGELRAFLSDDALRHDLLTFNKNHVSGHLTIVKNSPSIARQYRVIPEWWEGVSDPRHRALDENLGFYGLTSVYCVESYNTPLSPYIPWRSGLFEFPAAWYYVDGKLFNNLDGDLHFMYLHFMRYKYLWKPYSVDHIMKFSPTSRKRDWRLSVRGFRPFRTEDTVEDRGATVGPVWGAK